MASVIVPTREWTDGCEDVVAGLADGDQLVVVADHEEDPVLSAVPGRAETVVAGDPVGCSGKANALAAGIERADDRIVVWSDADVDRDADWRDRLVENAREHGAATEVPVWVGDGIWSLLEPSMILFGSWGLIQGGYVWGGGVAFDRRELDVDRLVADLRRTVGDDSLLSTRLDDPWVDRDHPRRVPVEGDLTGIYHRMARWAQGAYRFEPLSTVSLVPMTAVFAAVCLFVPLVGVGLTTAVGVWNYRSMGIRRASVALSYLSFLLLPVALVVALLAPSFEWGGRRYRWHGRFDVSVEG